MNNAPAILRTLIVYAICVPLSIWLGYMLTSMADFSRSTFIEAGLFMLFLCLPLLLRWHYILLVMALNMPIMVFFLPGLPPLWMPVLALSLGISVFQRTLNKEMRFISAPQITRPLICLAVVVLVTVKLTGGIGFHSLGSDVMGGKKYFFVFSGILAYFALTARRIPPHQAGLYIALFFLPQCLSAIGDLDAVLPPSFNFVFWFFPPNAYLLNDTGMDASGLRFGGVAWMSSAVFIFMLAKYGIRGIFMSGKLWRLPIFVTFGLLVLVGGFRSAFISCILVFLFQFYLEGLHRTKLLPRFVFAGMLACALAVPFAQKLPYVVQRSLAFLPLNIDPMVRLDAQGSSDWRVEMWTALLPQVPGHLLLGKGYLLTQLDYEYTTSRAFRVFSADEGGSAVVGDYHNGPLSVVLPFGIWGVIAFLWLLMAGVRALYDNYRYGDQSLRTINTLLLAAFLGHVTMFFFVFGGLSSDMIWYASILGLSVSLNGCICRPMAVPVKPAAPAVSRPRLQAGFQR